jgi:nucleotide-binding universal stress UspA family protein
VLFAYDGSALAKLAIEQAARQLAAGREALVVCVWQPGDVGFDCTDKPHLNAAEATEVRKAAQELAEQGAALAEQAGFHARPLEIEAAPTWKGLVETAEAHEASLIVLGSHHRTGLKGRLLGSVASAVVVHAELSVLVVHS